MKKRISPFLFILILSFLLVGVVIAMVIDNNTKPEVEQVEIDNISTSDNNESINTETNINTAVDTSNWQTYTNTKYGYSFKVPTNWYLLDYPDIPMPDSEAERVGFGGSNTAFRVRIQGVTEESCDSLESCIREFPYYRQNIDVSSDFEDILVAGVPAKTEIITRPDTGNWIHYIWYLLRDDQFYTMYTASAIQDDVATKPIYDAIVSSVQFIK